MQETVRAFVPPRIEPNPLATGPIGFLRAMISNPVTAIPEAAYRESVAFTSVAGQTVVYICDPDIIAEILIRRHEDFRKTIIEERVLGPALGKGLLTAEGDDWRWKRRLTAPHFTPAALAAYLPNIVEPFEVLAQEWRAAEADTDISPGATKATMEVINRVVFGRKHAAAAEQIPQNVADYLASYSWVFSLAVMQLPAWTPHPGRMKLLRSRTQARETIGRIVRARREETEGGGDICSLLISARDPDTGRTLSDEDLVDMLLTLITAGHDTSATALTWGLYCLAMQPGLQERLRAEVREVVGDRAIEAPDLARLVQLQATINETMRLFPPAPIMARQNVKPETIARKELPPGTSIFMPMYALHRNELLWERPGEFDIDRFMGANAKQVKRTAYMPFGAGPHICVGGAFSIMELTAGLATLLRNVRFEPSDATKFEPVHRITLKPRNEMFLETRAV